MIEGLPAGPPVERPAGVPIAAYGPRCVPDCVCLGGHTAAPHHLSGPPPPATAMLEIGAMVAVPIVSAATASTIASDVFMAALLSGPSRTTDDHSLKRDRPCPLVLVCNSMKLHPDIGGGGAFSARLELERDGNSAQTLERIRPGGHSSPTGPHPTQRPVPPVAAPATVLGVPRQ